MGRTDSQSWIVDVNQVCELGLLAALQRVGACNPAQRLCILATTSNARYG